MMTPEDRDAALQAERKKRYAALQAERKKRVEQVRAALLEGVRKYMPNAEHVDMADDALVDLYKLGIIDKPQLEFDQFLDSLRNPSPPEPVGE